MKCLVCGKEITGATCPRDGFFNIVALDDSVLEEENIRADEYRKELASKITDISVVGRKNGHDKNGVYKLLSTDYYKISDGIQCLDKVVWLDQQFGQHPETEWKKENLEISYKFAGKEYKEKVEIMPIQTEDYWKLGVKLNIDFTLEFYLGDKEKYSVSDRLTVVLN